MKYILILFLIMAGFAVKAQRLYLQEMESGNYKSYDIGDEIELMLKDTSQIVKGTITSFQKDGITLNDTLTVKLAGVFGLVKHYGDGRYTIGRVLLIVLGSYMLVTGAIYTIAGLIITALSPPAGLLITIVSAGYGAGGYAIINSQIKRARKQSGILVKQVDNVEYRLFIE